MISRRSILSSVLAAGLITLLGSPAARADEPIDVVATFSILGDLVQQVGGDRVKVTTLVGPDGDAHVYQPTPSDARAVAEAKLVFVNGMGFEGWIDRLTEASGYKGPVVTATAGIEPLQMEDHDEHNEEGHKEDHKEDHEKESDAHGHAGHDHGGIDPHAWQSLANARIYVSNIADGLSAVDPAGSEIYRANAAGYMKEIDVVESQVLEAFAPISPERRKVVTSHDAFGYFSAAYGIDFYAPVGANTEAEASAGDVARLIRQIKADKISAVFVENISDRRLLDQIVRETGAQIGGTLYSDALSNADGPASTYIDMMRHNVRVLVAALDG